MTGAAKGFLVTTPLFRPTMTAGGIELPANMRETDGYLVRVISSGVEGVEAGQLVLLDARPVRFEFRRADGTPVQYALVEEAHIGAVLDEGRLEKLGFLVPGDAPKDLCELFAT